MITFPFKKGAAVVPAFLTFLTLQAQAPADSIRLDEVLIVAKSKARQVHEQAYAVSVVDLKKNYQAATPMNRILNTVTSVRIRENGGVGSQTNVAMNGFSGNQVRFFIDGMPMDAFGESFSIASLSANMADRVEIYKGVLPVGLGADALGGAVNIVTRGGANYLDATYSFGSFNTHRASLAGALTLANGFTVRGSAFLNYSNNDYKVKTTVVDLQTNRKTEDQWVRRFHDDYFSSGLKLEAGLTGKRWADYLLAGIIVSGNANDVQTGATMDAVYGGVKTSSWSVIPSIKYRKHNLFTPGLTLQAYATYNIVNTHNVDTMQRRYNWLGDWMESTTAGERSLTDARIRLRQWQGNANLSYVVDDHHQFTLTHTLTAGRRRSNDRRRLDDEMNNVPQQLTKNITALGYQIRYARWNASLFGKSYALYSSTHKKLDMYTDRERWEKQSNRQHNIGYGAAATYFLLPQLQVKLSAERAYRMPEVVEIFGDGLIQQSNPDLQPEKSDNVNLGLLLQQPFGQHRLTAEVNGIFRNTDDFILKGVSLTSNPTTSYDNIGRVHTRGIEVSLGYAFSNVLNVNTGYTYQNIKDRMKYSENESYVGESRIKNVTYGQRLPNIPYQFASLHADYNFHNVLRRGNRLTLNYDLSYTHEYFLSFPGLGAVSTKKLIPTQTSHDVSVAYSMQGGRYSVMLECTNLTDELLYDNYRLQKPGRAFNMKFRYFINKD